MNTDLSLPVLKVEVELRLAPELRELVRDIAMAFARVVAPPPPGPRDAGGVSEAPPPAPVPVVTAPARVVELRDTARATPLARPVAVPRAAELLADVPCSSREPAWLKVEHDLAIAMRRRRYGNRDIAVVLGRGTPAVSLRLRQLRADGAEMPVFKAGGALAEPYHGPIPDDEEINRLLAAFKEAQAARESRVPVTQGEAIAWGRQNKVDVSGEWNDVIRRIQRERLRQRVPTFAIAGPRGQQGSELADMLRAPAVAA